ncbi:MAG: ribosome assembly factor SBDS [Halobacteriales archaeon]
MISLDKAVIARLEKSGSRFEVLVDPDAALLISSGDFDGNIEDVIAADDVFEDVSRGDRPAEENLIKVFNTTDPLLIIPEVIRLGDIQITAEQRREMQAQKHRQLITIITRNAINPQMNNAPHPPARIEAALDQAGFRVDPLKPVENQVGDALDALRPLIPIRFEEISIAVRFSSTHAGKAQAQIRAFGTLEKEEWQNDGSWIGVVRFPAGMQDEFYNLANGLSQGEAETRIIK